MYDIGEGLYPRTQHSYVDSNITNFNSRTILRNKRYKKVQQMKYLQSKCFFFGPIISCVVALHTVLDIAEPVTLCWAAVILSVMLCPDIPNPTKCSFTGTQMCPRPAEWLAFNGSVFKRSVLPDKTGEQREMATERTTAGALQKEKKTETNNFGNKHSLKTQKRASTFKHYEILTRGFNRSHVNTSRLLFSYN